MAAPSPMQVGPIKGTFLISTGSTAQGWTIDNHLPVVISYTGYKTASGEYMYDETAGHLPIIAVEDHYCSIGEQTWSTRYRPWSKMGFNPDVSAIEKPVNYSGVLYWAASSGVPMQVVSGSNNDKTGSTGCTEVFVKYLDSAYIERSTVITMNGTTAVVLADTSIARIQNFQASAGLPPAGLITISPSTDSTSIVSSIPAGLTRARNSMYTVPINKTLLIKNIYYSAAHLGTAPRPVRLLLRSNYNEVQEKYSTSLFWPISANLLENSPIFAEMSIPLRIPEKTDIYVTAITISASSGDIVKTILRGYLVDNT